MAFTASDFNELSVIGRGQYGTCSLAEHKPSGQLVVIKKVDIAKLSPESAEAAEREVGLLSSLHHPSIVHCYGSFMHAGVLCIVIEYCERGDLGAAIKTAKAARRYFAEEQILDWFAQLLSAVTYCHSKGVLHRDIKATNVFLTKNNMVRLGDFGISKVLEEGAMAHTTIGTPYYMSPEICEGRPYSASSDMWSLGCVLYEMCTLQHAFKGDSLMGLVLNIVREDPTAISTRYSVHVRGLIDNLLSKDATDRMSSDVAMRLPVVAKRLKILEAAAAAAAAVTTAHVDLLAAAAAAHATATAADAAAAASGGASTAAAGGISTSEAVVVTSATAAALSGSAAIGVDSDSTNGGSLQAMPPLVVDEVPGLTAAAPLQAMRRPSLTAQPVSVRGAAASPTSVRRRSPLSRDSGEAAFGAAAADPASASSRAGSPVSTTSMAVLSPDGPAPALAVSCDTADGGGGGDGFGAPTRSANVSPRARGTWLTAAGAAAPRDRADTSPTHRSVTSAAGDGATMTVARRGLTPLSDDHVAQRHLAASTPRNRSLAAVGSGGSGGGSACLSPLPSLPPLHGTPRVSGGSSSASSSVSGSHAPPFSPGSTASSMRGSTGSSKHTASSSEFGSGASAGGSLGRNGGGGGGGGGVSVVGKITSSGGSMASFAAYAAEPTGFTAGGIGATRPTPAAGVSSVLRAAREQTDDSLRSRLSSLDEGRTSHHTDGVSSTDGDDDSRAEIVSVCDSDAEDDDAIDNGGRASRSSVRSHASRFARVHGGSDVRRQSFRRDRVQHRSPTITDDQPFEADERYDTAASVRRVSPTSPDRRHGGAGGMAAVMSVGRVASVGGIGGSFRGSAYRSSPPPASDEHVRTGAGIAFASDAYASGADAVTGRSYTSSSGTAARRDADLRAVLLLDNRASEARSITMEDRAAVGTRVGAHGGSDVAAEGRIPRAPHMVAAWSDRYGIDAAVAATVAAARSGAVHASPVPHFQLKRGWVVDDPVLAVKADESAAVGLMSAKVPSPSTRLGPLATRGVTSTSSDSPLPSAASRLLTSSDHHSASGSPPSKRLQPLAAGSVTSPAGAASGPVLSIRAPTGTASTGSSVDTRSAFNTPIIVSGSPIVAAARARAGATTKVSSQSRLQRRMLQLQAKVGDDCDALYHAAAAMIKASSSDVADSARARLLHACASLPCCTADSPVVDPEELADELEAIVLMEQALYARAETTDAAAAAAAGADTA